METRGNKSDNFIFLWAIFMNVSCYYTTAPPSGKHAKACGEYIQIKAMAHTFHVNYASCS
jgi:hypothetical protein